MFCAEVLSPSQKIFRLELATLVERPTLPTVPTIGTSTERERGLWSERLENNQNRPDRMPDLQRHGIHS